MARDRIATVDQRSLNLFLLYGTVPMTLHQQQYFIPVQLWLPLAYPAASPLCYVAPTAGMAVRSGQYVKPNGRLMPTYVTQWTPAVRVGSGSTWHGGGADTHRRHDSARGPQTSNLGDLVAALSAEFGQFSPVISVPAGTTVPPGGGLVLEPLSSYARHPVRPRECAAPHGHWRGRALLTAPRAKACAACGLGPCPPRSAAMTPTVDTNGSRESVSPMMNGGIGRSPSTFVTGSPNPVSSSSSSVASLAKADEVRGG